MTPVSLATGGRPIGPILIVQHGCLDEVKSRLGTCEAF